MSGLAMYICLLYAVNVYLPSWCFVICLFGIVADLFIMLFKWLGE
jgi:hypothetical protein